MSRQGFADKLYNADINGGDMNRNRALIDRFMDAYRHNDDPAFNRCITEMGELLSKSWHRLEWYAETPADFAVLKELDIAINGGKK